MLALEELFAEEAEQLISGAQRPDKTVLTSGSRRRTGRPGTISDTSLCCCIPSGIPEDLFQEIHSVGISLKSTQNCYLIL